MKKMKRKSRKAVAPIITTLFLVLLVFSVAVGTSITEPSSVRSGKLTSMVHAMTEQLSKQVGENVFIKVKIENTGTLETVYLVEVFLKENGGETWEKIFLEDLVINPAEHALVEFNEIKCTQEMVGKHYDVKIILTDPESSQIFDEEVIEQAWYVNDIIISASIIGFWIS
jgi:hypothetical protein